MSSGSSFRLILKNLGAIFLSNIVSVLTELVQPALFLRSYGVTRYADWIVISSAVSYLSTLNFGMQTYVNQDLAIRYARGEVEGFHVRQSSALRALIGITLIAGAACLVVFVIPVERIFNLSISHFASATAIYFTAMQVLIGALLFSYFGGAFMGVGLAHRGNYWNNAQRAVNAAVLCGLAALKQPLYVLALGQLIVYCVMLAGIIYDLKRNAAPIFPTLKYWDKAAVISMLKPSAYFGLLTWGNFFGYEAPLILLRRIAGPAPVVIFLLGRKLFSFGRQILTGLSQSLGPEITLNFGQNNWPKLFRLYDYSERVIFWLIAVVNVPLFAFSPLLLTLWLHKAGIFDLNTFLLLGLTAAVIAVKEHKNQFQYATNTHESQAKTILGGYVGMAVVSIFTIKFYGLPGMVATWLATEIWMTWAIVQLNKKLFGNFEALTMTYIWRLTGLAGVGFAGAYAIIRYASAVHWSIPSQFSANIAEALLVAGAGWYLFQISTLSSIIKAKVQGKFRRSAPAT